MALQRVLKIGLAASAMAAAAEQACAGEEAEEMVTLQTKTAANKSLMVPPPRCGYAQFVQSTCEKGEASHATLVEAKAACWASDKCAGILDGSKDAELEHKFWICKRQRPHASKMERSVFLRMGDEECPAAFLQQEPLRIASTVSMAQLPAPLPGYPSWKTLSPAFCFYPDTTSSFSSADTAANACNSDSACAGIYNTEGGSFNGYADGKWYKCKAPNNFGGCGSWYQEQIQGVVYWKEPNPNNNECQGGNEWA